MVAAFGRLFTQRLGSAQLIALNFPQMGMQTHIAGVPVAGVVDEELGLLG